MRSLTKNVNGFKKCGKQNGKMLAFSIYYRRLKEKIFNRIFLGRKDLQIDPSSRILGLKYIKIGKNFHAGKDFWLEAVMEYNGAKLSPQIIIGDNVSFSDFGHIGATHYIKIGNNVLFGSKCYITDHNHGIYSGDSIIQSDPKELPMQRILSCNEKVIIEDNVWIGDSVAVLPGVRIGEGAIIGTNSVITKDIPPYSIAIGSPAKTIKQWNFVSKKWEKI